MFEHAPEQLRRTLDLDGLTFTVGGIRHHQLHPGDQISLLLAAVLVVGTVLMFNHPVWAAALLWAMVFGYYHYFNHGNFFNYGNPEQIEVRLTPTHIRWTHHDIDLRQLVSVRLESVEEGPVLDLQGPDAVHRLYLQLEPMEHAIWLCKTLKKARIRARRGGRRGSARDVPRALRERHTETR